MPGQLRKCSEACPGILFYFNGTTPFPYCRYPSDSVEPDDLLCNAIAYPANALSALSRQIHDAADDAVTQHVV